MQAENTQNQYTPVEGGIKVWKQRVNSFGVSEPHLEALNLPISQKVEEVTKLLTSAQTIDELSWLWEQRNDFKVKSKDVEYKTLSKLFTEYEKLASAPFHNQEDAESVLNFSLSYQLVTPQLTEAIQFIVNHETKKVTFDQLEAYINGTSSISDSELAKTFEENKDFLQNFVQSYQTWFVQPLTQIQGNSLEEGLAKFREIGVEFIQAERVEALNTIKDLLVKIANQLSESEDVQTSEVFSVITEVASKPAKSFKEASIKKLEVWFEHITENSLLANIHDQEYTKIITLLGNYFWKLRAQLVLGKKKYTKKDAMTVIRSIPLEIIRDDTPTEELTKLVEVAELEAFAENEDVDATCRGTLNQEEVTQTLIFDLSDKLIASKLSSEKRQLVCLVIEALTASTNFEKIVKGDLIGRLQTAGLEDTKVYATLRNLIRFEELRSHISSFQTFQSSKSLALSSFQAAETQMPLEEGSLVEFTTLTNEIPVVVEQKHANEVTFANDRLTSLAVIKQKLTSFHLNDVVKLVQFSDAQNVTEQFKTIISEYYQNLVKFDRTASNSQVFTAIEDIEPLYRVAKSLVEGRASDIAEADIAQITVVHTNSQILREYHQLRESSKQGNQEDSKMAHETLIRVQQKKMTPITLEEAHTLISEGKVPEGYNLPVDKFTLLVEAVQKNLSEVLTLGQKNDSSYSSIRKRVNFLKQLPFILGDEFATIVQQVKKAQEFVNSLFKKRPTEITETLPQIDEQYKSLNMVIEEYVRLQEDIARDQSTVAQVENLINDGFHTTSLDKIVEVRHLYKAARYFKNPVNELKLVDIHIMAVIKAYKQHNHKTDPVVIDFLSLKDLYNQIMLKDIDTKEKKIKPDNAAFIIRLYEKCHQYCKKHIDSLSYQELQANTKSVSSFLSFVDLTGKIIDRKTNLKELECVEQEKSASRSAIKPSGKKSIIANKVQYKAYNTSSQKFIHAKPAFINRVTPQHQNYYVNAIDFYLRTNKHLNFKTNQAQESFKQAQVIEKMISKKYYDSPLRYEQVGDRVVEVLQRILRYKFITLRIKNKRYELENILYLRKANEQDLKRYEMSIQKSQQLARKEAKQSGLLAKRPHPGAVPTQQNKSKDEIELKTSSLVPTNYKTYHIFNGSFKLNGEDNVAKNFNNINLLTFDTDSNVTKVTEIPSVILKTTITAQGLNEYLRGRVFKQNKEKKGTYLIHQGWLESNASTTAMKNLLIKQNTIGSNQYSKRCKIFVFPKTAVQSEWLEKLDFWCNSPQVDLFYMIIVKSSVNNHETVCVPRIYNKSANRMMFKLQSSHHVMERNFFKPQQKKYKNFNQNQQMKQSNKFTRTGRKQFPRDNNNSFDRQNGQFNNRFHQQTSGARQSMSELFFGTNEARRDRFGSKENLFNELVSTPQENAHVIEPSRNFGTSLTNRAPSNTALSNLVHKKAKLHFKNNEENSFGSFQANPSSLALAKNIITKKNVAPKQPLLSSALFNSKDVLSIPIKKKNAGNKRATQQKPIHKRKNHIQQATVPHILVQTGSNVQPQAQKTKTQKFQKNQKVQNFNAIKNQNQQFNAQKQRRKFGAQRTSNSIERSQSFERAQTRTNEAPWVAKKDKTYAQTYNFFSGGNSSLKRAMETVRANPTSKLGFGLGNSSLLSNMYRPQSILESSSFGTFGRF